MSLVDILIGWAAFILRVFPMVTVRWDGVIIFLIGFIISCGCAKSLLSWLEVAGKSHGTPTKTRWTWSATSILLTLVLLVFLVGLSMAGVVHQSVWLFNAPEPWLVSIDQSNSDNDHSIYRPGEVAQGPFEENWMIAIMPYVGYTLDDFETNLIDRTKSWNAAEHASHFRRPMPLLINPSLEVPTRSPDGFGLNHVAGNSAVFTSLPKKIGDFDKNLLGQMMMVAEVNAGFVPWGHPNNSRNLGNELRNDWSNAPHSIPLGFGPVNGRSTVMMLMVDGRVREISTEIDIEVLRQLGVQLPNAKP